MDVKKAEGQRIYAFELWYWRRLLRVGEVNGIPSVAVKCVDIGRNTSGEGGLLDDN